MQTIGLLSTIYWCCYAFTHLQLLLGIICGCQGRRKTNLNFVLFKLLLTWYCVRARKGTQVCWWEQWKGEVHWWELGSGRNKTKWHLIIALEMRQFNIMDGKRKHHHHFHYYFDSKNLIMNFPFSNFFSLIWWLTNPKQPERPTKHTNKTEKFSPGFSPAQSLQKRFYC